MKQFTPQDILLKTAKQPAGNYWSLTAEYDTNRGRRLNRDIKERGKENSTKTIILPE